MSRKLYAPSRGSLSPGIAGVFQLLPVDPAAWPPVRGPKHTPGPEIPGRTSAEEASERVDRPGLGSYTRLHLIQSGGGTGPCDATATGSAVRRVLVLTPSLPELPAEWKIRL